MRETTIFMQTALILAQVISIYNILIWIRIILTWVAPMTNISNSSFYNILKQVVDPFLSLFRNVKFLKTQRMDFTPLLAFAVLSIVQSILSLFGSTGSISLGIVLALIINTLWTYFLSPLCIILIGLIIFRLVLCYRKGPNTITMIRSIESIISSYLDWMQKIFFVGRIVSDRLLLIVSTIVTTLLYLLTRTAIVYIVNSLVNL